MSQLASIADGLSGAAGGVVALVTTYPLMTISTNQAVNTGSQDKDHSGPTNAWEKLRSFLRLYSGLGPAIYGTAMSQGVYFYLYSAIKGVVLKFSKDLTVGKSLLVAALAGCGNVLLTNPIWVVVTRMQVRANQTKTPLPSKPAEDSMAPKSAVDIESGRVEPDRAGESGARGPASSSSPSPSPSTSHAGPSVWQIIRDLYAESGFRGFWKGLVPSLVMVSNPTIQYVVYESLTKRVRTLRERALAAGAKHVPTAGEIFLTSAAAKTVATVLTYPLLVVKSRLQALPSSANLAAMGSAPAYSGTLDAVLKIMRQEGLAGFFKGIRVKIVQSVLAAALLFMVKEEISLMVRKALGIPLVEG